MRGSPFQAGLAASRRPVLHVRASQAGLCAEAGAADTGQRRA